MSRRLSFVGLLVNFGFVVVVINGEDAYFENIQTTTDLHSQEFVTQSTSFSPTQDDSVAPKETRISTAERTLKQLVAPLNLLNEVRGEVRNVFDKISRKLPKSMQGILETTTESSTFEDRSQTNRAQDVLNFVKDKFRAIYPGTLWCGDGDIAKDSEELGFFKQVDSCCRTHDSCNNGITARQQQYGLSNNGIFTRSECSCDQEFYICLKNVRSIIATKIGITFFNVLSPQCFKEDYPIKSCNRYGRKKLLDQRKCLEYNQAIDEPKQMQWFDNPDFV